MKKIYFLSIMMLVTSAMWPLNAEAQNDVSVWDGFAESWTHGNGTENNPYLIENARQLAYIAEMVNAGITHYDSTYFKLTTDIRIDSSNQWQPIGFDDSHYFSGNFDGGCHSITLYLFTNSNYVGLFGYINGSSICNLNLHGKIKSNTSPSIGSKVGLIGYINSSSVYNCTNYCNIELNNNNAAQAGGIGGYIIFSTIVNCANRGTIMSQHSGNACGGICGYARHVKIYRSYNVGNLSCSSSNCGGIIGYVQSYWFDTVVVSNCYNTGDISSSESGYIGGICSYISQGQLTNCYNIGTLYTATNRYGIAPLPVSNCYYLNTCGQNIPSGGSSYGGIAKTEAQMKSPSFPIILNSDSVVYAMDTLNINQGYPIFANAVYVLTQDAENVGFTSATLKGVYSGGADIKGFKYKQDSDSVFTTVYCSLSSPFSYDLTELPTGTTYQYVYFIQKNGLTYYGDTKTFTTTTCDIAVNITKQTDAICMGDSVSLVAQAQSAYSSQFTYVWSTGESGDHISPNQNGQFTVTASAGNGCEQTQTYSLSLYPSPEGVISGDTVLCAGGSVTLTASGAWSYQWNNGHTGATISVAAPGAYSCTFTNEYGCTSEKSVTITSFSNFSIAGNPHICSGESTVLNAPAADSCLWNNGAQSFSIMVSEPGIYGVTLYHGTCDTYTEIEVTSAPLPTPTILGNTTICEGESTTLTANGGVSFAWSNGNTSNSVNVSQSGVYTVTATNAEGCSATANVTVTVNPLPSVNINGNNSFCQGDNVTLTATGANTYVWSNTSTNASITVSSAGSYTVTGTDANGCSNIATKTVAVNPTYNIPLTHSICEGESYNFHGQNITTAGTYTHTMQTVNGCDSVLTLVVTLKALPPTAITGNTSLCEGETTTLTANGGVSYVWSNASTGNSISVSQSGVYTVTATNAEGCSAPASVTVTVNPLPTITIAGNTTLCAGNSTTLTASGADSYSWSTGDNTASVSISAFGIYSVTGTTTTGCSNTAEVTVLVSQLPVITISGETDICAGESTTLTANGGETYLWSDGTTNNTLIVNIAGTYQVIGYNAAGCNAMANATVNVWQPATSEFSIFTEEPCYSWNNIDYCESGDYTQTLQTIYGCDSTVTLHLTITVGIDDHNLSAAMTVYPNPTNGIVNVQCTMNNVQVGTMEYHVFDAYGKLVGVVETRCTTSLQTTQIDLSHYASGVYLVKAVANGNVVAVRKIVIK